jgi:hypothetical protein
MFRTKDTPKLAYLRNRPFLLVQFFRGPAIQKGAKHTRTEQKGWMKGKGNVVISEHPLIVDRVSDKQLAGSGLIIDLLANTVIKNSHVQNDDAGILTEFGAKYADLITRAKQVWINQAIGPEEAAQRLRAVAAKQLEAAQSEAG